MRIIFTFLVLLNIQSILHGQIQIRSEIRRHAVLAQFSNSSGSGFFLLDSNFIYFVTAGHVLIHQEMKVLMEDTIKLISYRNDVEQDTRIEIKVSLKEASSSGNLRYDSLNDAVVVRVAKLIPLDTMGNVSLSYFPFIKKTGLGSRINGWPIEGVLKFSEVEAGSEILIIGYPKSLGLRGKFDLDRPLFRKGIVAGKDYKFKKIIGDGAVYHGNSGGMVLQIVIDERKTEPEVRLIGLVSEFIPFEDFLFDQMGNRRSVDVKNSGYSVISPIESVLKLIASFPN